MDVPNFLKRQQDVLLAIKRFPLATLSIFLLTILALMPDFRPSSRTIPALFSIFSLGTFWFISIRLFSENRQWNPGVSIGIALAGFALMGVYIYRHSDFFPPSVLLGLGLIILIPVAPFLGREATRENVWAFNYHLCCHISFSFLASLVLEIGVGLLLLSLDYLFHFKFFDDQYYKLGILIVCLILPMIVMAGMPSRFDEVPIPQQGKGIQLLLNYVMAPILLVFGLIIVSYALKILGSQNLPRGKVSYLVSLFGGIGSLTFLLGDRKDMVFSSAHRLFRRHFFHLMVIPLILMGIGIGVRVHEYGFTRSRYLLTVFFLWLVLCTLYSFVFSSEKLSRFMLMSATSLLVLGSFGPWGVVEVCTYSQLKR